MKQSLSAKLTSKRGSVLFVVLVMMSIMIILASAVYYTVMSNKADVVVEYSGAQGYTTALNTLDLFDYALSDNPALSPDLFKKISELTPADPPMKTTISQSTGTMLGGVAGGVADNIEVEIYAATNDQIVVRATTTYNGVPVTTTRDYIRKKLTASRFKPFTSTKGTGDIKTPLVYSDVHFENTASLTIPDEGTAIEFYGDISSSDDLTLSSPTLKMLTMADPLALGASQPRENPKNIFIKTDFTLTGNNLGLDNGGMIIVGRDFTIGGNLDRGIGENNGHMSIYVGRNLIVSSTTINNWDKCNADFYYVGTLTVSPSIISKMTEGGKPNRFHKVDALPPGVLSDLALNTQSSTYNNWPPAGWPAPGPTITLDWLPRTDPAPPALPDPPIERTDSDEWSSASAAFRTANSGTDGAYLKEDYIYYIKSDCTLVNGVKDYPDTNFYSGKAFAVVVDTGTVATNVVRITLGDGTGTFDWKGPAGNKMHANNVHLAILVMGKGSAVFTVANGTDFEMSGETGIMPYNMGVAPGEAVCAGRWVGWSQAGNGYQLSTTDMLRFLHAIVGYNDGVASDTFMHIRDDVQDGTWAGASGRTYVHQGLLPQGNDGNFTVPATAMATNPAWAIDNSTDYGGIQANILFAKNGGKMTFAQNTLFAGFCYAPNSDYYFNSAMSDEGAYFGGLIVGEIKATNKIPYFGVYPSDNIMSIIQPLIVVVTPPPGPGADTYVFFPKLTGR